MNVSLAARIEGVVLCAICVCVLIMSFARNRVWEEEFTLWMDVSVKNPASVRSYNNIGSALMDKARFAEAVPYLIKAVAADPRRQVPHFNLALSYMRTGRVGLAEIELLKTLEVSDVLKKGHYGQGSLSQTYDLKSHGNLGNIFTFKGEFEKALYHFEKAIALAPDNASLHYNLGLAYKKMGRMDEAAARFSTVLKLSPDDKGARWNLMQIQRGRDLVEPQKGGRRQHGVRQGTNRPE